ncbi:hypothetical protein FS837_009526 [Tulasnella sp. UAMH 9824]|nr:hypothetical protein FS837_009526 [Tulasnella sp. UAMH 9824]
MSRRSFPTAIPTSTTIPVWVMAANLSGTLNIFRALVQPRLIVPDLSVKTIRAVDWHALRRAGYVGAVFDKDNCLTRPYDDKLVPELNDAWEECKEVFGRDNVLIVSNSAGTKSDAGLIQAESVSHHLGVPVLAHTTKKPGCIKPILRYFAERHPPPSSSSPPPHAPTSPTRLSNLFSRFSPPPQNHPKIIVVGDRLCTDVLMANRIGSSALAIWTTGLWVRESMFLRRLERLFLDSVLRYRKYCRQKIAKASDEIEPPDPSIELAKQFTRRPRTHHHHGLQSTQPVPVVPRAWYTRYTLAVLGSSWGGLRWLFVRLTEGRSAREARRTKKQEVDRILQGDPEYASRPGIVKRIVARIKSLRQSPSPAKLQEAPAEEMKSSIAEPPSIAAQQRVQT